VKQTWLVTFAYVRHDRLVIAASATIFNGARIGPRGEVRVNGIVHLRASLPEGATVPLGWIAGDPVKILPPHEHERVRRFRRRSIFRVTSSGSSIRRRINRSCRR
jgi:carbonic anhydrase/acetyltransferase-like protein (isoleucine patch superfamily)